MEFTVDEKFAADVGKMYGDYVSSYNSEHGQVRASLFRQGDRLVAYVVFPREVDPEKVTDRYYSELWSFAKENGYDSKTFELRYNR
jgi:hypothetical protein